VFRIIRAAIPAVFIALPQAAFPQTVSSPPSSSAPTEKATSATKDDHSYLPPSMQGQTEAHDGRVQAKTGKTAEASSKKGKLASRHVKPEHHYYAEDSDWARFDD
jgi:hypothetical protein